MKPMTPVTLRLAPVVPVQELKPQADDMLMEAIEEAHFRAHPATCLPHEPERVEIFDLDWP